MASIPLKPYKRSPDGLCSVERCGRSARGLYCGGHTNRLHRWGDLRPDLPLKVPARHGLVCSATGCERPATMAGLCGTHHSRRVRTGDVRADIPIRSVRPRLPIGAKRKDSGGYVLVKVGVGVPCANSKGWAREHHVVMATHLGRGLLPEEEVHHRNGVRDDNRQGNLELWSTSQPKGQRVVDKLAWAKEILALYPEH